MNVSLDTTAFGAATIARPKLRAQPSAEHEPRRRGPAPLPPPPPELAVLYLSDSDLRDLRRGLARALEEVGLGSGASRVVGRLSRLTRTEIARRERRAKAAR